jgi:hypothetical protein
MLRRSRSARCALASTESFRASASSCSSVISILPPAGHSSTSGAAKAADLARIRTSAEDSGHSELVRHLAEESAFSSPSRPAPPRCGRKPPASLRPSGGAPDTPGPPCHPNPRTSRLPKRRRSRHGGRPAGARHLCDHPAGFQAPVCTGAPARADFQTGLCSLRTALRDTASIHARSRFTL